MLGMGKYFQKWICQHDLWLSEYPGPITVAAVFSEKNAKRFCGAGGFDFLVSTNQVVFGTVGIIQSRRFQICRIHIIWSTGSRD